MNSHLERILVVFKRQFEQVDGRVLFRKNQKGAPIELREAERDFLIGQFESRLKWFYPLTIVVTLVALGLMAGWIYLTGSEFSEALSILAIFLILAPMLAGLYWAWDEPSRFLRSRHTVGEARTAEEMKSRALGKLSWRNLGVAGLGILVLLARVKWNQKLLSGTNLFILGMSGALVVLVIVQACRKWLSERHASKPPPT